MRAKRPTPKRRTETFSTKEELLAKLIPKCEEEYAKLFGHPWSKHPLTWYKGDLRRSQIEADAWRAMKDLGNAAAAVLDFFETRGLDPNRHDHGIYYAHELYKLLKRRRRLLESLKERVGEYTHPIDRRHWLAKSVNVRGPNVFAGRPYGRKLTSRELALVSFLMHGGDDLDFKTGMTIGDAIDQERRRMANAIKRLAQPRKKR